MADTIFISTMNGGTAIYTALVIFSILGFKVSKFKNEFFLVFKLYKAYFAIQGSIFEKMPETFLEKGS